jgi:hypothetical protein
LPGFFASAFPCALPARTIAKFHDHIWPHVIQVKCPHLAAIVISSAQVGGLVMSQYRVRFFKTLLSSDGHPFKCLQQQIDVPQAEGAEQAEQYAARELTALRRCRTWTQIADVVEVDRADA